MVLPQNPRPVPRSARLLVELTEVELPAQLDDELPIARSRLLLGDAAQQPPVMALGAVGLTVPWTDHPHAPSLLIPGAEAEEIRLRDRWRFERFHSPSEAGLPFTGDALARAAWHVFGSTRDLKPIIDALVRLATELDVLGYGSAREVAFAKEMQLPADVERQILPHIGRKRPLLDVRCLRWIITELCIALARGRRPAGPGMTDEANAVLRAFLPLSRQGLPFRKEIYRAVWFLHEGFQLGGEGATVTEDPALDVLSMVSAYSSGVPLFGENDERALRAVEMWQIEDDDAFISGRGVRPSEMRSAFERSVGLTTTDFLALCVLDTYARRASVLQLSDATRLVHKVAGAYSRAKIDAFARTVRKHLSLTPRRYGLAVLDEMRGYGLSYGGLGTAPRYATETVRDHPVLELTHGLQPWGLDLFISRAIELPGDVYRRQESLSPRELRGKTSQLFEARLQHRVAGIAGPKHWVATGRDIDHVVPRGAKRPDAIIGSATQRYIAVEINASRLTTGVMAGDAQKVSSVLERYVRKRRQSEALVQDGPRIIAELRGTALVSSIVPLVVTDEPLPTSPALEQVLRSRHPDMNPRFVCSVDEFELLLDLGEAGWDIPDLVHSWQRQGRGTMLGTHLMTMRRVTSIANRSTAKLAALVGTQAAA